MEFNLDTIIKAIVDLLNKVFEVLGLEYEVNFAK